MSEIQLNEIFLDEGVRDFGTALRKALRMGNDYASLVELEYVETNEAFAEWLKKFLRRYESHAKRYHLKRPQETSLAKLVTLVDKNGVKAVRAALIAWSLVKTDVPEPSVPQGGSIHG